MIDLATSQSGFHLPLRGMQAGFRRFTVQEYHQLIQSGILTEDDDLELLEGYLVHKMSRNPPHDFSLSQLSDWFFEHLSRDRRIRIQMAITLTDSEPEPDLAVVRGHREAFRTRHPIPEEIDLVIEVADSTLESDRTDKARIYARAGIPTYWIVNLEDRQIEVYSEPILVDEKIGYQYRQQFNLGELIPIAIPGLTPLMLPVDLIVG